MGGTDMWPPGRPGSLFGSDPVVQTIVTVNSAAPRRAPGPTVSEPPHTEAGWDPQARRRTRINAGEPTML